METRLKEHRNFRKPTAITEHLIQHNHDVTENFEFLSSGQFDVELLIKVSLFVKKFNPPLNHVSSYPLEIF